MEPESTSPRRGEPSDAVVDVELVPDGVRGFAATVSLRGEHDLASAAEVTRAIGAIAGNVLVDLTECSFIDSTIIEVLIGNAKNLEREGHFLEIVAPPENSVIARTLEIVGMRDVVVVHAARPIL
jgi:anti-anti-sigma factor